MTPDLPFEFVVEGVAVSLQGTAASIQAWKDRVREAARGSTPEGSWLLTEPLAVTVYIFPGAEMQGDLDNRLKPIFDAMSQCVYSDDQQIERIVAQRFEPGRLFAFEDPSEVLVSALESEGPVVYVRVTDRVFEDLR